MGTPCSQRQCLLQAPETGWLHIPSSTEPCKALNGLGQLLTVHSPERKSTSGVLSPLGSPSTLPMTEPRKVPGSPTGLDVSSADVGATGAPLVSWPAPSPVGRKRGRSSGTRAMILYQRMIGASMQSVLQLRSPPALHPLGGSLRLRTEHRSGSLSLGPKSSNSFGETKSEMLIHHTCGVCTRNI